MLPPVGRSATFLFGTFPPVGRGHTQGVCHRGSPPGSFYRGVTRDCPLSHFYFFFFDHSVHRVVRKRLCGHHSVHRVVVPTTFLRVLGLPSGRAGDFFAVLGAPSGRAGDFFAVLGAPSGPFPLLALRCNDDMLLITKSVL